MSETPVQENNSTSHVTFDLRPHHCGISVVDLEQSISWYHDMLGFEEFHRFEVKEVPFKAAMLKRGDFIVELFDVEGAAPLPESRRVPNEDLKTRGTKHIAFEVEDIHAVFAELKGKGVDVAWDIFELDGMLGGFIRDNTGNLIEILQRPQ